MRKLLLILSVILISIPYSIHSQDVLMQGWYWDYPKTDAGANWADTIRLKARGLGDAGFTYLWAPPLARPSGGMPSNGYDPKDLYDYGEFAGPAGYGTRQDLDSMVTALNDAGIKLVADMIYNHRDGGRAENNPGLKKYIDSYLNNKADQGDSPFPYDRMRCFIPLGMTSGNAEGNYFFRISSSSGNYKFWDNEYSIYMQTSRRGWKNLPDLVETEPNGGYPCNEGDNIIALGRNMDAKVDASGCTTDEFNLKINKTDFNGNGDTLFIYFGKRSSNYSDMRIYSIWSQSRNMDIINDLVYQTYTDFSAMPSGKGEMHWNNFKPNLDRNTGLSGDWDFPYFYYDYDQYQEDTKSKLIKWTQWNWSDVGVRGLRMDAVKHFAPEFVGDLLDSLHAAGMDPGLVVGEWYSSNAGDLAGWVNNVLSSMDEGSRAAISPRIFDFSLRENLRKACDEYGFDVRNVYQGSLADAASLSGFNVVTFLNNHDFRDENGSASLVHHDPILGYAYILTNNKLGLPCIYYPDYYGYPVDSVVYPYHPRGLQPLRSDIDKLMQIQALYINGASTVEYLNRFSTPYTANYASGSTGTSLIYQVSGGAGEKEVIVAINFSGQPLKVDQEIKMENGLAPGDPLTDIAGNSAWDYAVVSNNRQIYIELPPRSWSVWVQGNPVAPLKPSDLQAKTIAGGNLQLSWTDNSPNEVYFILERKDGPAGQWVQVAIVPMDNVTFTRKATFSKKKLYFYRIKAMDQAGESKYSNVVESHGRIK